MWIEEIQVLYSFLKIYSFFLILWFQTPLRRGVLDTTFYDKVCQWLATARKFSLGTPVSSTNKKWPPWYNRNIVESVVKHYNPPPPFLLLQNCSLFFLIWIFHMIIIKVKFTALKSKFLFQRFNYGRKITTDRWLSKKLSSIYQYKPEAL